MFVLQGLEKIGKGEFKGVFCIIEKVIFLYNIFLSNPLIKLQEIFFTEIMFSIKVSY
jgi:hypothetical protein